ncbi:MAG: mycothiol synthase [Nocardioides sp.]
MAGALGYGSDYGSEIVALMESVRAACRAVDGADPVDEATELRLKHQGLSPAVSAWTHPDGLAFALLSPTGSAGLDGSPGADFGTALELTLAVRPSARQSGIGGTLLKRILGDLPAGSPVLAWAHGDHPAARRLAQRHGFETVRELWVLRTLLDAAPAPRTPLGITLRSYRPRDAADLIGVNAAAFADHPEQGRMDATNLAERMAEPWFDPADLLVATDQDEKLVGFHWTKVHPGAPGHPPLGEVYVIGVSPAASGRGLGRVLMEAGLAHLAGRGAAQVHLYVESGNRAALAMYQSFGFTHAAADTHVRYLREA